MRLIVYPDHKTTHNAVTYILLSKLDYGYHNQAPFHLYRPNATLFSCETFYQLTEKYKLSYDTKISKSLQKSEKIRLGSLK